MRTEPTGRPGRFHEAGFYRCDAEFAVLIVPFVEDGVAAGQPVILGYDDRKASLLRSWLHDPGAVTFIAGTSLYATPARAIASYWQLFEDLTAAGATQIRIAGEVPHEGNGGRFAGWDRYESAASTVWNRFPVWSRCLYDAATAAARVLDIAARTHPRIVLPSGQHQPSRQYQDVADFHPLPPDPDPLEDSVPAIGISDPSPAQVRHVLTIIAYVSGASVRLVSRTDKEMAASYPELAVLAGRVTTPVILDGEIVALRAGRPDFGLLQSRMHVRRPAARLV
jgi:MEDS: MEthanogen/methylotroph, DcmR Sensory domain